MYNTTLSFDWLISLSPFWTLSWFCSADFFVELFKGVVTSFVLGADDLWCEVGGLLESFGRDGVLLDTLLRTVVLLLVSLGRTGVMLDTLLWPVVLLLASLGRTWVLLDLGFREEVLLLESFDREVPVLDSFGRSEILLVSCWKLESLRWQLINTHIKECWKKH